MNTPIDKSETYFEDDSLVFKEPEKKIKKRAYKINRYSRKKNNISIERTLPEDYMIYKRDELDSDGNYCYNCIHFKKFYCHKWSSNVEAIAWCESWERKQEIK